MSEPQICPECEQGKHGNCVEEVLLDDVVEDMWVACPCPCRSAQPALDFCPTCADYRPVLEAFEEQQGYEEQAKQVWVTVLDCGHQLVEPMHL